MVTQLARRAKTGAGGAEHAETAAPEAAEILSVIVAVLRDDLELEGSYRSCRDLLRARGPVEFIYVLDRHSVRALATLTRLKEAGEPLVIVVLGRWDGEVAALRSGLRVARGEIILTLPAVLQVEPDDLARILDALPECDLVVARRWPLEGARVDSLQAAVFHRLVRILFGHAFQDLVCRVRACRRAVFDEITGYGMQQHFLPLLAADRGFRIREITVRPSPLGSSLGGRLRPLARIQLSLDALALFVVTRFIRKPLRFFGALGLPILFVGLATTGTLVFQRLFLGEALADRPALILGALLVVLGIQVVALGLIGEIIIYASGKRLKDYIVERIL